MLHKFTVIMWRKVYNDAVVGEWQELQGVTKHTDAGLKEWMLRETDEQWHPELIEMGGYADGHLRNYGPRLQFWIPILNEEEVVKEAEAVEVVCVDTFGLNVLTTGKVYHGTVGSDGLYELEDDNGKRNGFFKDRFNRLKVFCGRNSMAE